MNGGGDALPASPAPGDAPWRSGSRLRARVIDGGDGALLFAGWFDRELGIDCTFSIGADGTAHCLPNNVSSDLMVCGYRDATCDTAIASAPAVNPGTLMHIGGSPPGSTPGARCSSARVADFGTYFRAIGSAAGLEIAYSLDGSECRATPGADLGLCMFGDPQLWQRVPLETFVAATVTEEPGPLPVRWLAAEDGAYEAQTLLTPEGEECDLLLPAEGDPVCMTVHAVELQRGEAFLDASCTGERAPDELQDACGDAAIALVAPSECQGARGGFPGKTVARELVSRTVDLYGYGLEPMTDTCPVLSSATELRLPGDPVDPSALPALDLTELGSGRLRAQFGTSSGGLAAHNPYGVHTLDITGALVWIHPADLSSIPDHARRSYWFYDTERDELCAPVLTTSGSRCLPAGSAWGEPSQTYLDPACTEPAIASHDGECPSVGSPLVHAATPVLLLDTSNSHGLISDVLVPTDAAPVSTWYSPGPGGCTRVDGVANDRAIAAERIPVSAFAEVSARME